MAALLFLLYLLQFMRLLGIALAFTTKSVPVSVQSVTRN